MDILNLEDHPILEVDLNKLYKNLQDLYYILSLKHTKREDYVFNWWGPNSSGYTVNLDLAGKYELSYIEKYGYNKGDTIAIKCSEIDSIAVKLEYNYDGWEEGRFVLNDEVFWNTYNIDKKIMYSVGKSRSNKRYFRYIVKN